MFCEAIRSTRGSVTCCDDVYCSSANDAGFPIFKPPRRAGRANSLLSRSLGASLPVSLGSKVVLIEFSRGSSSCSISGVVLER